LLKNFLMRDLYTSQGSEIKRAEDKMHI